MVGDFAPLVRELLDELSRNTLVSVLATRFHLTLADVVAQMAEAYRGMPVVLGGGCFQNRFLLQTCIRRLREGGHEVYWAEQAPTNDGGISLGQAAIACILIEEKKQKT